MARCGDRWIEGYTQVQIDGIDRGIDTGRDTGIDKSIKEIKGPDNPTSQLLPIIRKSGCSGTEKEEKTKEMVDGG